MPKIIKTKKKNKNQSKLLAYMLSAVKGLIVFVSGILIISLLLLKSSESSIVYFIASYFVIALGAFISGYSGYKSLRGRGYQNGLVTAGIYVAVIFILITALMRFNIDTNILLIIPISLVSGFVGGTVGANT